MTADPLAIDGPGAIINARTLPGDQIAVELHLLRAGDQVVATGEIVAGVQVLGPVTIVDFEDGFATAPLPSRGLTVVRRNQPITEEK